MLADMQRQVPAGDVARLLDVAASRQWLLSVPGNELRVRETFEKRDQIALLCRQQLKGMDAAIHQVVKRLRPVRQLAPTFGIVIDRIA